MKAILFSFLFLLSFSGWSKNKIESIALENEFVLFAGYRLNFYPALEDKFKQDKIQIVFNEDEADALFSLKINQKQGRRFKRAEVVITITDFNQYEKDLVFTHSKRCLMISCSVRDFSKAIQEAIAKFKL